MRVDLFSSDPEHAVLQQSARSSVGKRRVFCAGQRSQGDGRLVMCGICGVFHSDRTRRVNRDTLVAMNRQIVHRGPDDDGFLRRGRTSDWPCAASASSTSRPVTSRSATKMGSVWIVFNGEIYNHQDLRKDLESRGHRYRTKSDTETIVHLYEEYGRDCVEHLRGMFAFAIWDRTKRSLFLARDRLGIKPLYYRLRRRTLCCSARKSKRSSPIRA